jgi:exosortase A-associated hydrolase 1
MRYEEQAVTFRCAGEQLHGVLSLPERPAVRGVLIIVGGPQYRAGSHRQFTLLARTLAERGIPVQRFDYRGMGDSDGAQRDFGDVELDVRAAVDHFMTAVPGMREVVLWGLCDGASAALFYAGQDARVRGLVLLNPWVRTEGGAARATLKHYYRGRLLQGELWRKLLSGRFDAGAAWRSLRQLLAASRAVEPPRAELAPADLPSRMLAAWSRFQGPVLLILSGADLTAKEFTDLAGASSAWQNLLGRAGTTRHELDEADHTFSRRAWRDQVADWTANWVTTW